MRNLENGAAWAALPLAALCVLATAAPASADVRKGDDYVDIWTEGNFGVRICGATITVRSSDGYVKGGFSSFQPYSISCKGWLERKTYNTDGTVKQNWTKVTNFYFVNNSHDESGYHWNGTNAGTRICMQVIDTGEKACSYGIW
ncbi:hypothetical protein [Actinomadura parmotrematis]|uniref:DUF2690 domain-containing protein n=1 Tax=Actinomadura parmotrematis TaxID=2864039 RepID=A0ABS7G0X5_9ACTN|nr:hypothetical protein [Actinomadura parmotrematis]MBW8486196.1 hypothetical protein [Actinomadura parmotrematis]